MKKVSGFLLTLTLALSLTAQVGAFFLPSETRYPVEDGEPIYKVYELTSEEQIAEIPREEINYNGQIYRFSDISTEVRTATEMKEHTETVHRGTALTSDPASILAVMVPELEVTTEDGYSGVLTLDPTSLKVEPETYGTSSRKVTLTRTYPSVSEMDVALLPQTVTENGLTYSLTDCSWALAAAPDPYDVALPEGYTATAVYTATRTSRYAKTYAFSVEYTGTLTHERTESYHCIAVFAPYVEDTEAEGAAAKSIYGDGSGKTNAEDAQSGSDSGIGWKISAGAGTVGTLAFAALYFLGKGGKKTLMLFIALGMTALMGVNANALSYNIDGAVIPNTAQPTSISDYAVPAADAAAILGKNAAYAPPAFGSPESYIPNRSEPLIDLRGTDGSAYGAVIGDGSLDGYAESSDVRVVNGFPAVDNGPVVAQPATAYTELTAQDYYSDGRIGSIRIAAIGVDFGVYEGADTKTMNKGAAHITNTSVWDGNICLAAHNRGVKNNFGKIQTLRDGDRIELTTVHGTRVYSVYRVEKIAETDVSILAPSAGNILTLTTCVANEREFRYVVQRLDGASLQHSLDAAYAQIHVFRAVGLCNGRRLLLCQPREPATGRGIRLGKVGQRQGTEPQVQGREKQSNEYAAYQARQYWTGRLQAPAQPQCFG